MQGGEIRGFKGSLRRWSACGAVEGLDRGESAKRVSGFEASVKEESLSARRLRGGGGGKLGRQRSSRSRAARDHTLLGGGLTEIMNEGVGRVAVRRD